MILYITSSLEGGVYTHCECDSQEFWGRLVLYMEGELTHCTYDLAASAVFSPECAVWSLAVQELAAELMLFGLDMYYS